MRATISRLFVVGALALALPSPTTSANEEKSPTLHDHMERFGDAYKGFRRETDAAVALPLVREAQGAAWHSMALLPPMVEKMPDGPAKVRAVATYRNMMAETYLTLTRIELAFLEGDMEAVAELVKELRGGRKAGHRKFMED